MRDSTPIRHCRCSPPDVWLAYTPIRRIIHHLWEGGVNTALHTADMFDIGRKRWNDAAHRDIGGATLKLRALVLASALAVGGVGMTGGAVDALGQTTGSCNGQTMWGNSGTTGASSSALACNSVRVRHRYRVGASYYWSSYKIENDGDVEFWNPDGSTTNGTHGAKNSAGVWVSIST